MTLVYHGTPTLYPEPASTSSLGEASNIAAIRFPSPVRLKSIRVHGEGVVHPTGVGLTSPSDFTADILLNVAPSEPVNALAKTSVRVTPSPHAIDYKLDMPEGTTTRLVVIRAPAQRITMSLYAHDDEELEGVVETMASLSFQETKLPLPPADDLLALLPRCSQLDSETRGRFWSTLAVVARRESVLARVLDHPGVEALQLPGAEEATASILGIDASSTSQESLAALLHLNEPWTLQFPSTSTPLSTTLALAKSQRDSLHPRAAESLSVVLERLDAIRDIEDTKKRATISLLARTLPPLAVHAITRGASPTITLSAESLPSLQASLAGVAATGESLAPAARRLIAQIVPPPAPASPPTTSTPGLRIEGVPALPSLQVSSPISRELDSSFPFHASSSAAGLLSALAPGLYSSLGTARNPPLGVPPTPNFTSRGASHYAGKVYSAHEFRRERDTTSGLGVGASSVGRKASRHVDEFARA